MGHLKVFIEFVTILFLFYVLVFVAVRHVRSQLPNQESNLHPPCIGRQSLKHWTGREVPSLSFDECLSVNVSESNPAGPDLSWSSPTVCSSEKTTGHGIKASSVLGLK